MGSLPTCLPSPHGVLRSSHGCDSALERLTIQLSLHRERCSPSYGNAAACGLRTWRRWPQGGPQTTCSGSFTPATGMSTVSAPHFFHGGQEDAEGGGGAHHHSGGSRQSPLTRPVKTSGSVLSLSLDLFPANHPPEKLPLFCLLFAPYFITPSLLA